MLLLVRLFPVVIAEADYEISKKDGPTVEIKEAETVGEDWGE